MKNKLAKLEYLPNNFKILEEGDHVICAVSAKIIKLEELNYWNVELQEAYYSYKEAFIKNELLKKKNKHHFQRLCDQIHWFGLINIILSSQLFNWLVILSIVSFLSNFIGLLTFIL